MIIILCNLQFEGYVSPCPDFSVTLSRLSRPSAPRRSGGRLLRGVAQLASASGLGPEGRVFESHHPDEKKSLADARLFPFTPFSYLCTMDIDIQQIMDILLATVHKHLHNVPY